MDFSVGDYSCWWKYTPFFQSLSCLQIAYEETGNSDGIQKNLRFLESITRRLELNSNFRHDDVEEHLENLECAALDVSSAMMNYLSCAMRYFSKRLISELPDILLIEPNSCLQLTSGKVSFTLQLLFRMASRTSNSQFKHMLPQSLICKLSSQSSFSSKLKIWRIVSTHISMNLNLTLA